MSLTTLISLFHQSPKNHPKLTLASEIVETSSKAPVEQIIAIMTPVEMIDITYGKSKNRRSNHW
jgi:hypothetical protein